MLESADTETVTTGHHGQALNSVPGAIMITPAAIAAVGAARAPPFHATDTHQTCSVSPGWRAITCPMLRIAVLITRRLKTSMTLWITTVEIALRQAQQPRKSWAVVPTDPLRE